MMSPDGISTNLAVSRAPGKAYAHAKDVAFGRGAATKKRNPDGFRSDLVPPSIKVTEFLHSTCARWIQLGNGVSGLAFTGSPAQDLTDAEMSTLQRSVYLVRQLL
jgi:hypothetical protein